MKRFLFTLASAFALFLASSCVSAAVVEHTFNIGNLTVSRLCNQRVITAVNGSLPGPTINVEEGDTLVVHAINDSPYNITLHWHGIFQLLSAWADGPESVTQCPIRPGERYTYKYNITGQEGEWWNANVVDVENDAQETGLGPVESDAYTINGLPGDSYNCSQNQTYQVQVKHGKTYLLRIINAALNEQHFFMIANHTFTVVAIDASYTKPYNTDVIVLAPGQTVDALMTANQTRASYYMVFTPYHSNPNVGINANITRGLLVYHNATSASPVMPSLPPQTDTPTVHKFYTNITGLGYGPHWVPVPRHVDEHMFVTFGIGLDHCNETGPNACNGLNFRLSANMNNESFVLPKGLSMMEAMYRNVSGVYTRDFPSNPPFEFNYTDPALETNGTDIAFAPKSTKVKTLRFNSTVQVVLQNTAILARENHPIHLHSFNFHVLAQGFGNYDANVDESKFNLNNPQIRNTIAVPVGGWAVIRFQANNPGMWLMHCHLETHLPWGLAMAFEVENGPEPWKLPPPPADLPQC
ncbi:hypothetical protein LR48_Vigan11g130400 [Vigna angularis]|uniref:laccase n=1 Tax=Phaseolus angularis TaxID=3914 RepID=A0A0L9VT66_PHAAN|nr:hypothetical protein LR48_Vigan11g130400 [Vigna angularis]